MELETLTKWEDGWRVRLPLPFQLKWIHSYLFRGAEGYTIVDCGLNDDRAWATWQQVFAHLRIEPQQITRIVLTHYHPDHYGLAGKLQELTGAEVWMSRLTYEQAQLFWGEKNKHIDDIAMFFRRHGLPNDVACDLEDNLQKFIGYVTPHPDPQFLEPGETVMLGDRPYDVWHTPGHAEDHLSFFDSERQWLIGGDVLLRKITPNVSLYQAGDQNPLETFLTTLKQLKKKPIRRVLPAHGPLFTDVATRIEEILAHHDERLQQMKQLVDGKRTAYDICLLAFGNNLSVHNLRFALAETLAHLEYLRQKGELLCADGQEITVYRQA
ncbi:MBL fold metallo-hydrolase [Numidum massiliense]|uniref:MBL fold metallo-hydrolase n=1 Tax=Numidum massiliense TaxID=1522315 RepID=UPI0006D59175|nr:MBL fold metallo-hydrolase [Numidum massiliense]